MATREQKNLIATLKQYQSQGDIAELDVSEDGKTVRFRTVGPQSWARGMVADFEREGIAVTETPPTQQAYYFFSSDLRPGSGLIRFSGGKAEGQGGTLTCFTSSCDDGARYLVSAGHVLSNFWSKEDLPSFGSTGKLLAGKRLDASIYRYQKGFPASDSRRFLGKLVYLSPRPRKAGTTPKATPEPRNLEERNTREAERVAASVDIGIVKLRDNLEIVQRTTCYGSFGDCLLREGEEEIHPGQEVMKCGAEEPHWTFGVVQRSCTTVTIYGPKGAIYELPNQVILALDFPAPLDPLSTRPPSRSSSRGARQDRSVFAVPGDSGSMVVDRRTRHPVGMLIGGSVLDGLYVMTPIPALRKFLEIHELIFRRD